jgi:tetratricopeptide (TPR) repeat protein
MTRTQWLFFILLSSALVGIGLAMPETQPAAMAKAPDALEDAETGSFEHIPTMTLSVVRVIDDDFAPISDDDVTRMLATAQWMYKDKFGADNVRYADAGVLTIEQFFGTYLNKSSEVYANKNAKRYLVGQDNNFTLHKDSILAFIKQWKVEELTGFFPESERAHYATYDDIYAGIVKQMTEKIAAIGILTSGGKALLRPEKAAFRSFLNWLVALELQDRYDVVLTNTFILYDDISQPSPHSIFGSCKVGGVSHQNTARTALGGRVIMGSTFGMDTDIPLFMETGDKPVARDTRNDVIGAFVIAHELGHAIFKLPDHYDHPPECLMNNSKELNYREGYELLLAHPGPCPRCHPWMEARHHFFEAEFAFSQGQWQPAIDHYNVALKQTPSNVDGYRPRYMAQIVYKMSQAYEHLGQNDLAIKGAQAAVKLYRWDNTYTDWLKTLEARTAPAEQKQN